MADIQSARRIVYSPTPFSTWFGVICVFVLFGLIVLVVVGPSPRGSDYEQTRAQKRMERLKALHEENQKELTAYAWLDKGKDVARIPIDRAMDLTVAELAQKKPEPAGPIATPASAEATAGKPAAQPTPAAASPVPAASQQPGTAQPAQPSKPAASPTGQNAAPPSPASPAPATTP